MVGNGNCTVVLPNTGEILDLNPLGSSAVNVSAGSTTFQLTVCAPLSSSPCLDTNPASSGCQIVNASRVFSTGSVNKTLSYSGGAVRLHYAGGTPCSNGANRTTDITFQCDPTVGVGHPKYIGELSHCAYSFSWATSLVCSSAVSFPCTAHDNITNATYDLSSLSSSTHNWIATSPSYVNTMRVFLIAVR